MPSKDEILKIRSAKMVNLRDRKPKKPAKTRTSAKPANSKDTKTES